MYGRSSAPERTAGESSVRPCPACGGEAFSALGSVNGFLVCRCLHCGTIFTERLPRSAEAKDYEEFYASGRDLDVPPFVLQRLDQTVASLERYRRLNRWLDIGCGAGTLLQALTNRGWHPVGTEVAPTAVKALGARGFEVYMGDSSELVLSEQGFDVVSLIEVVEHVPDPASLLDDAARLVRPGGAIYVTTPNGRSLSVRLLGLRWTVVAPPEHLQLFSVKGLHETASRAGCVVKRTWTHGLNPHELRAGMSWGRARPSGQHLTETSYRLNESLTTNRAGRMLKRLLNGVLSGTRTGDTLKVLAERRISAEGRR